MKILEGYAIKN